MNIRSIPCSFLFLAFTIVIAGCNSSTSTNSPSSMTPHTMTATVNGASWSSAQKGMYASAYALRYGVNGLRITGIAADSSEITIEITNLNVGTDSLSAVNWASFSSVRVGDTSAPYLTIPSPNQTYSGWITITASDTTVSGTFQFVGHKTTNLSDSVTVTSGSFYQLQFAI